MEEIIPRLYVGGDADYEKLKDKQGWKFLRCCKEGPGGHRQTVGYVTLGAPKGPGYLAAKRGDLMALNFIDANDPNFIPVEMIRKGLDFVANSLTEGHKVLVACNAGHSRGPTTAMLYLRSVGELPGNFVGSEKIFKTLYQNYDPGIGVRQFARTHWNTLKSAEEEVHG